MVNKKISKEEYLERIVNGLHCSLKEAEEIYNYDQQVEKGESTEFDLTKDQEKIAKTFSHTGTRKTTNYNFTKRERKENATKGAIISELAEFFKENSNFQISDLTITNKERQIAFSIGSDSFELTLVQKRKKK